MSDFSYAVTVGVSLPNTTKPRWYLDGYYLKNEIEDFGNEVLLLYANDDPQNQIKQIESLIDKGCEYLLITPIDPRSLNDVLHKAKEKNITVISYDRLLMDTNDVDYYLTYDSFFSGKMMGDFIEQRLALDDPDSNSKNIELFAGALEDSNVVNL